VLILRWDYGKPGHSLRTIAAKLGRTCQAVNSKAVAQENCEPLPVVATCLLHVVVVQTLGKKPDIRMRGLCLKLQPIRWHGYLPAARKRPSAVSTAIEIRLPDHLHSAPRLLLRRTQFALPSAKVDQGRSSRPPQPSVG
jgi:hypothetical protein